MTMSKIIQTEKKIGEKSWVGGIMKKSLKDAKSQVDQKIEQYKEMRDADNRIVIDMIVRDDSNFLSPFSESKVPVINSEVAQFIENRTKTISLKEPLTLKVHSNSIDEQEKTTYTTAIKEYFAESYAEVEQKIKRNNFISLILLIMGIATLAVMLLLEKFSNAIIWVEIIDIMAWVFLWEAFDVFILQNHGLKVKRKRYLSLIEMKVEYLAL